MVIMCMFQFPTGAVDGVFGFMKNASLLIRSNLERIHFLVALAH